MVENLPLQGMPTSTMSSVVVDIRGGRSMFCAEGMLGLLLEMLPLEKSVNLAFVMGCASCERR